MKTVRCAIYTRKSSEEGLEQDFNSLDAQREACAAYVLSQASEGWRLLPDIYDDGGISGGTLERPALQRLLTEVKNGRIDIIVVYKVDRLTRSLLDFAKLVEALDANDTSFVSVTQSFNTTTSMGRLTLNMLLSFAQFEREVTAERIRDKIAASKAKGMWMGGIPPLGYRPDGRSLAIVDEHAAIVRNIFERYLALGNVRQLADALAAEGTCPPLRQTGSGRSYGGRPFTRGQLYFILRNPIYVGEIPHKERTYPGNHPALIDRAMWDAVQGKLADNRQGVRTSREQSASLLSGLLFDTEGEPLIAVHTTKGSRRYRYYVSKDKHHCRGSTSAAPLRLRASEIEQLVRRETWSLLADPAALLDQLGAHASPTAYVRASEKLAQATEALEKPRDQTLRSLLCKVVIAGDRIEIQIDPAALAALLGLSPNDADSAPITHVCASRLTRTGRALRVVQDSGRQATAAPDPRVIRLLARAHSYWAEIRSGDWDIARLSRRDGVSASYVTRIVRLAFLAPAVVEAALVGSLRSGVGTRVSISADGIDAGWTRQIAKFVAIG
jgi:DNA invertase Pin-like site-specific DNA recombinase